MPTLQIPEPPVGHPALSGWAKTVSDQLTAFLNVPVEVQAGQGYSGTQVSEIQVWGNTQWRKGFRCYLFALTKNLFTNQWTNRDQSDYRHGTWNVAYSPVSASFAEMIEPLLPYREYLQDKYQAHLARVAKNLQKRRRKSEAVRDTALVELTTLLREIEGTNKGDYWVTWQGVSTPWAGGSQVPTYKVFASLQFKEALPKLANILKKLLPDFRIDENTKLGCIAVRDKSNEEHKQGFHIFLETTGIALWGWYDENLYPLHLQLPPDDFWPELEALIALGAFAEGAGVWTIKESNGIQGRSIIHGNYAAVRKDLRRELRVLNLSCSWEPYLPGFKITPIGEDRPLMWLRFESQGLAAILPGTRRIPITYGGAALNTLIFDLYRGPFEPRLVKDWLEAGPLREARPLSILGRI